MADYNFIQLEFDGVKTSDLNLYVVSNSGRYIASLTPQFENRTTSVPGRPGLLYWGTEVANQTFNLSLATDGITGAQFSALKSLVAPGKIAKLRFQESLYKEYNVIVDAQPVFNFVPFVKSTPTGIVNNYKGELELVLSTLSPYATSPLHLWDINYGNNTQKNESNLPALADFPSSTDIYSVALSKKIRNRVETTATLTNTIFHIYHAGNAPAPITFSFSKQYALGAASGGNGPKSNWADIKIGESVITKPRYLLDIELALQETTVNFPQWGERKAQVVNMLRDTIDGPHKNTLIGWINATGSGGTYTNLNSLYDHVRAQCFTDRNFNYAIDGQNKQVSLSVSMGNLHYMMDEAGGFNGKFLYAEPSKGLPITTTNRQTITSNAVLDYVIINFKNTYV